MAFALSDPSLICREFDELKEKEIKLDNKDKRDKNQQLSSLIAELTVMYAKMSHAEVTVHNSDVLVSSKELDGAYPALMKCVHYT